MNYWIHRISHHAELSYPLLERGFLTIGFSDFTNTNIVKSAINADWKAFNEEFQVQWGSVPRTRHSLWNFFKMEQGDKVVVPGYGVFWLCEIEDNIPLSIAETFSEDLKNWGAERVLMENNILKRDDGGIYDLGFARKVRVLYKSISWDKFADAKLTSRMKIRQTNAQINDLKESVDKSIENYKENRPLEDLYLIVWMDGIVFKVRENSKVINKTVYLAVGLNREGRILLTL